MITIFLLPSCFHMFPITTVTLQYMNAYAQGLIKEGNLAQPLLRLFWPSI